MLSLRIGNFPEAKEKCDSLDHKGNSIRMGLQLSKASFSAIGDHSLLRNRPKTQEISKSPILTDSTYSLLSLSMSL